MVVAQPRNRSADALISEQHVQLARILGQAKGKVSERLMYYRKAPKGLEAGWIVVQGTNAERQNGLFMKGMVPLHQYGIVNPQAVEPPDPDANSAQAYRHWAQILTAPGGPEEFPVSQLMEYRWYDQRYCPVPGVRFPQLEGAKISKFWCPECESVYFHRAIHLARHLRSSHEWDRAEIAAYGDEAGISFTKEAVGDRATVETVEYAMPEVIVEPELPMPQMDVEEFRAAPRRRRSEGSI